MELKSSSSSLRKTQGDQTYMKKIMSLMLGLSILAGVAAFADDATTTATKKTHATKTHKTKKTKAANTGA